MTDKQLKQKIKQQLRASRHDYSWLPKTPPLSKQPENLIDQGMLLLKVIGAILLFFILVGIFG
jgi:hypothetical protein